MPAKGHLQFFDILQQTGFSKSRKGPPFYNFENFLSRSRLATIFRNLQSFTNASATKAVFNYVVDVFCYFIYMRFCAP